MQARALFLSPEPPLAGSGGGGLRSASLLEYLRREYSVDVLDFALRPHSKSIAAKAWRNSLRLLRGVPPLFDRYSGYEAQLSARLGDGEIHARGGRAFLVRGYAPLLAQHCGTLVLDLHNIESELARTHALAARVAGFLGFGSICGCLPEAGARMAASVRHRAGDIRRRRPP